MEAWLAEITGFAALIVEAMATIIIVAGSLEAFVRGVLALVRDVPQAQKRALWMRYSRWLVAGLTFQLAADLLHTAIAPSWDDVGRLAAIAGIRTFLNFFLERDLEAREEEVTSETAA